MFLLYVFFYFVDRSLKMLISIADNAALCCRKRATNSLVTYSAADSVQTTEAGVFVTTSESFRKAVQTIEYCELIYWE